MHSLTSTATAIAHPNIAFVKYWGNCNADARIPANGSISMNLDGLESRTTVTFDPELVRDSLEIDGTPAQPQALDRVSQFLDHVRQQAGVDLRALVSSQNNFPMGAGIASSASAFAALALSASRAAGLDLGEVELSRLARLGSGSACRSVPAGFVEWIVEDCKENSAAISIAGPGHWELVDCVAVISQTHKPVGSTQGHALAFTSPLQDARVADAQRRLDLCRGAILSRDFDQLAQVMELDSNMMHAVMMTSRLTLLYWLPETVTLMHNVQEWRSAGLPVCYTIDAGPNVHVITLAEYKDQIIAKLEKIPGVREVLTALPGGPAQLLDR